MLSWDSTSLGLPKAETWAAIPLSPSLAFKAGGTPLQCRSYRSHTLTRLTPPPPDSELGVNGVWLSYGQSAYLFVKSIHSFIHKQMNLHE